MKILGNFQGYIKFDIMLQILDGLVFKKKNQTSNFLTSELNMFLITLLLLTISCRFFKPSIVTYDDTSIILTGSSIDGSPNDTTTTQMDGTIWQYKVRGEIKEVWVFKATLHSAQ